MAVWILLGVLVCVLRINGFSIIVTRGLKDSIQQTSLPLKFTRGLRCENGVCRCRKNFSTYIFDDTLPKRFCIKDYEIIKDRSRGKFLPGKKTKCIGINRKGKIANMSCKVDNLSVQWIWTMDEQMLNLKTLTCLRGDIIMKGKKRKKRVTEKLSLERCDFRAQKQKWTCTQPNSTTVRNKGSVNFTSKWINRSDDSYFQNCTPQENSYKGCYLFSDGNHMKLIDSEGCDNRHDGTCGQDIQIQAPIGIGYTSCELDWTNSSYAISGYRWYNFNGTAIEGIELNSSLYPSTLQIKNTSYLSKWKGHLLRLNIICTNNVRGGSESHCALLKVKGTATEEIPDPRDPRPTTSNLTTPPTSNITTPPTSNIASQSVPSTMVSRPPSSTNTSYTDFNSENRGSSADDPSIILPIAIAAGVVACLLLVAVAIMIIRKRRRKNADITQNEEHIYEEPYPVDNGPASPIYMEIDDTLTRIKSKKFDSGQNTKTSEKCETSESCEEPKDNPLYHTLEKDAVVVEVHDDDGIYDEVELVETPPADADFEKELNVSADADFEKELDV